MSWKKVAGVAVLATSTAVLMGASSRRAQANVSLSPLISDGMVLQQKAPVRLWGRAIPGEVVTVSIAGQTARTTADTNGNWLVTLKPLKAGGPFTATIAGNNTITLNDVLVGEVWVCSGQSNMEWTMGGLGTPEGQADVASANDPQLRMFTVPKRISATPQTEIAGGSWQQTQPGTVGGFSAVGYYFARSLRKSLGVPVGMIHSSWGGTRIEAWTAKDILLKRGMNPSEFAMDTNSPQARATLAAYDKQFAAWKAAGAQSGAFADPGIATGASGWEVADAGEANWKTIQRIGEWDTLKTDELAHVDGGVWFRKTIDVPASAAGKVAVLSLGAIDDNDTTWVNGVKVGATGAETTGSWAVARKYTVPAGVLKAGKNSIAIRVWDAQGAGGLVGQPEEMMLTADGEKPIPLGGTWRYKTESVRPADPGSPPNLNNPNAASVLYNGMLYPLARYTIKGALWYQGESNAGNSMAYRQQMPDMIQNWRDDWKEGQFPFYMVQLASFMAIAPQPQESGWAGLREAQSLTQKVLPNVGTAVITDVGNVQDIHPRQKQPVGERLALLARDHTYGEKIEGQSPAYKSMKVEGGAVTVTFDHVGGGLMAASKDSNQQPVTGADAGRIVGFALAGADGKYYFADATITGKNTVRISSPQVPDPKAVRFGWADFPIVNLFSKEGLPADPFRSDKP